MPKLPQSAPSPARKDIKISLPLPHPGQAKVIAEAKRYNVFCAGRRTGKSLLGRDRLVRVALQGLPTGWFSPTNKVLSDSWREIKVVLEPVIVDKSEQEHRLELIGGGVVEMWSLESPGAGRSRRYARVVVDEAAYAPNLKQSWESDIRPTLMDFKGDAWFLSSPRGTGNMFKSLYDRGPDPEWEEWASWKMPTASNPHIDPKEIEDARRTCTEAYFNQEYLAEFINWEGSVFRNVAECAEGFVGYDAPIKGHEYVIGIDWGRSRDYSVFMVVDVTARSVPFFDRSNKVEFALQRDRLRVLRDRWQPSRIIAEANSIGIPNIEELEREGVRVTPFNTTNASKDEAIRHLALAFEQMNVHLLPDPVLIAELVAFQGTVLPSGMIRYSAPEGAHDDLVMALLIAWTQVDGLRMNLGALAYMKEQQKVVTSPATKVVVSPQTLRCPECESTAVVKVAGRSHCNQCGADFGPVRGVPAPLNRTQLLKGSGSCVSSVLAR